MHCVRCHPTPPEFLRGDHRGAPCTCARVRAYYARQERLRRKRAEEADHTVRNVVLVVLAFVAFVIVVAIFRETLPVQSARG